MAIIYYGINPSGGPDTVIVSSGSSTGRPVEVAINNAITRTEDEVKNALDKILIAVQQRRLILT